MIKLDDKVFVCNSIIDLVVYPDMPVYTIIREMTRDVGCQIILDTQGNLYPHYSRGGLQASDALKSDSDVPMAGSGSGATCENDVFDGATDRNTFPGNFYFAGRASPATHAQGEDVLPGEPPLCTESAFGADGNPDTITSSMEHISHFVDKIDDSEDAGSEPSTRYYFINGLHNLIQKLKEIRRFRDFVLVIDSVTFVCDCSPFNLQYLINLLWAVVYKCNATVITVNHYRIGKIKRTYKLVPRMGVRWAFFVTYQVLFSYHKSEMVFSIREDKRTRPGVCAGDCPV